uniref:Uncharacterized protein n=1 Tax=Bradyrhizobium ottawaense TaxID=931866 RepID=A0A2U8P978_9BRAD|nr:hypothetical protein CIT37_20620 [Bradyrhizobium ottawaense]
MPPAARSNPASLRGGILDCFVARAPRNDEERAPNSARAPDAAQRPGDAQHRPGWCAAKPGPMSPRAVPPSGSRLCAATP